MVTQVRRIRLAEQTAELLLTRIRDGEWQLGHRIPGEAALAAQLGVGRSTMREAIRELAGKGVLETRQGAGVFVLALDLTDDRASVLRRATIAQVLEARLAIETAAASSAAERRTTADLEAIRDALAGRAVEGQSLPDHVDADMAFHRAVVVAAHNAVLTEVFDSFVPKIRPAMLDMLRVRPVSPDIDQEAHRLLVDAIADRAPEASADRSRVHLTSLLEDFS
ncbi:MAG: FCD domain-containing protein [Tomitella sp.]|nr:FCD domain-containing protein [Tomitella sp.]